MKSKYYCFCDTETGGLNAGQPILQLGWQITNGADYVIKRETFFFEPEDWCEVDPFAIKVNGLSKEAMASIMAIQHQEMRAISLSDAVDLMVKDMGNYQAAFVAYNSDFDIKMIRALIDDTSKLDHALKDYGCIDTMDPASKILHCDKWLSLVKAYRLLGGDPKFLSNAHEAHADIDMTRFIFKRLKEANAL